MEEKDNKSNNQDEAFNQHFLQLVIGLQSTVWVALGKSMNPMTKEIKIDLNLARDSIDSLLMLKEKTKRNLTQTEKGLLDNATQDLELNFIEVAKKVEEENKNSEKEDKKSEEKNNQRSGEATKKTEKKSEVTNEGKNTNKKSENSEMDEVKEKK